MDDLIRFTPAERDISGIHRTFIYRRKSSGLDQGGHYIHKLNHFVRHLQAGINGNHGLEFGLATLGVTPGTLIMNGALCAISKLVCLSHSACSPN